MRNTPLSQKPGLNRVTLPPWVEFVMSKCVMNIVKRMRLSEEKSCFLQTFHKDKKR